MLMCNESWISLAGQFYSAYILLHIRVHVCLSLCVLRQGGHSIVKKYGGGVGSIVWGLGFWLGKDILGFFKNIDFDNS